MSRTCDVEPLTAEQCRFFGPGKIELKSLKPLAPALLLVPALAMGAAPSTDAPNIELTDPHLWLVLSFLGGALYEASGPLQQLVTTHLYNGGSQVDVRGVFTKTVDALASGVRTASAVGGIEALVLATKSQTPPDFTWLWYIEGLNEVGKFIVDSISARSSVGSTKATPKE